MAVLNSGGERFLLMHRRAQTDDLVKQSFPFSYLSISVVSTDGASHSVQVYTDISAEWISGNPSLLATWATSSSSTVMTHTVQLKDPELFSEVNDHTQCSFAGLLPSSRPLTLRNRRGGLLFRDIGTLASAFLVGSP